MLNLSIQKLISDEDVPHILSLILPTTHLTCYHLASLDYFHLNAALMFQDWLNMFFPEQAHISHCLLMALSLVQYKIDLLIWQAWREAKHTQKRVYCCLFATSTNAFHSHS